MSFVELFPGNLIAGHLAPWQSVRTPPQTFAYFILWKKPDIGGPMSLSHKSFIQN